MPEGDTIHLVARRLNAALAGRRLELADAPNPRSPLHSRAAELGGATLEEAEAFGKHLVAHFSNGLALHSHLGMNGRWFVAADGRLPYGSPGCDWPRAGRSHRRTAARSCASSASRGCATTLPCAASGRTRCDPGSSARRRSSACGASGPAARSATRCSTRRSSPGSATRSGSRACSRPGSARGARSRTSTASELELVVAENERVMTASVAKGRRPRSIYRANRAGALPALRRPDLLARAGRRQPNRLLVSGVSGLATSSICPAEARYWSRWARQPQRCSRACRCSRSSRAPSSSGSPPWRSRARTRRACASSTRATTPTPATSSATATCGSPASTPTAARSRSRRSVRATSSASSRCSTAAAARRASRRSRMPSCSRCRRRTSAG